MTRFRAAVFDLDGVLADTAQPHFMAWKQIADGLGVPFDEVANEALKGIDRLGSLALILAGSDRRLSPVEKQEIAGRKNGLYLDIVAGLGPDELLLPGAIALVRSLREAGLPCAVASASRNAPLVLERSGMASLFEHVADPARVARPKPAPDLFLDCAAALGVDPASCLAFEDSIAGVEAIRSAGMYAVGIGDPAVLHRAQLVFASTAAVDVDRVLGA